jgi:hypothetical protein
LDLADGEDLSRVRALGWKVEKASSTTGSPSQHLIGEGWVSGLFSKLITDRVYLNKP